MNSTELLSLDPKTKSSKELIIRTLGNHWPLSVKEIHSSLVREQGFNGTYQATHKGMHELEGQQILKKEGKKYRLSQEWIEKSRNYFDSLSIAYEKKEYFVDGEKTIMFDNYTDFALTLGNMFNSKKLVGPKYTETYAMSRHLFWPLKFSFKDFELCISVGLNAKPHIICRYDTPFDRLIKKYYEIAKWPKAAIGAGFEIEEDIIVQGHTIVQIKYSEKTRKTLDSIYEKVHNFHDLFSQYLKNNTNQMEIEMKITQNPQVAGIIMQNIKNYMEGAK